MGKEGMKIHKYLILCYGVKREGWNILLQSL